MLKKIGIPIKIDKVASTDSEFENLRKKIAEENNLVRCSNCNKLLSKKGPDDTFEIQHKHLVVSVKKPIEIVIKCPACDQVNRSI